MYSVGDKIIYAENGVCIVENVAPLSIADADPDKLYYHLRPLVGSGTYFTPVNSNAFMRSVITKSQAEELIDSIPSIEPAICEDTRFNHVDAFYREIFRQHSPEGLVSILKGLHIRLADKKSKSSRAELTMKRARDTLNGELAVALDIPVTEVEAYIVARVGEF